MSPCFPDVAALLCLGSLRRFFIAGSSVASSRPSVIYDCGPYAADERHGRSTVRGALRPHAGLQTGPLVPHRLYCCLFVRDSLARRYDLCFFRFCLKIRGFNSFRAGLYIGFNWFLAGLYSVLRPFWIGLRRFSANLHLFAPGCCSATIYLRLASVLAWLALISAFRRSIICSISIVWRYNDSVSSAQ
jgi:hypothetical protein